MLVAGIPAIPAQDASAPPCPGREYLPGVGEVCHTPSGLLEVLAPDGGSLGFIHGPDPVPSTPPDPATAAAAVAPVCATDPATQHYGIVIYARASDDADRYATLAPQIRDLVHQANGHLREEAAEHGATLDYRMHCSGGVVTVVNEVLPTSRATATFSTIVSDLKAKGYTSHRVKHWVWYDDTGACLCGGVGHVYEDDRLVADNYNNGPSVAQPMFAVTFGYVDYTVMMHESGHNLGAVQNSAPRSSGALHCNDGLDIMCYADGGSKSGYSSGVCTDRTHFDCGHDDYFHPSPPAGSYLATHWNLGSPLNRFLVRSADGNQAPAIQAFSCSPSPAVAGQPVTCSFHATDDSSGVSYTLQWGDGSPDARIPASGTVAPGTTQTATHTYAAESVFTLNLTATDTGTPALSSGKATLALTVGPQNAAPVVDALSCAPNPASAEEFVTCTFRASDDSAGVYYTVSWGDGSAPTRVPASGFVTPGVSRTANHAWSASGSYGVTVTATDNGEGTKTSQPRTLSMNVTAANAAPLMTVLSCSPSPSTAGQSATCSVRATDDSTGVYYRIQWGDGTPVTRVPVTGYAAPGTTLTATHAWTSAGTFTVSATATDNGGPVRQSAAKTLLHTVTAPPCVLSRSGDLLVGLRGVEVEGVSAASEPDLPVGCRGRGFTLRGDGSNDFNVCWLGPGGGRLGCVSATGTDRGTIPVGATAALIVFHTGVRGTYTLIAS